MRNKATEDDDVPGDVFRLLGCGSKIMKKLINTIYENGEWPKDFFCLSIQIPLIRQRLARKIYSANTFRVIINSTVVKQ